MPHQTRNIVLQSLFPVSSLSHLLPWTTRPISIAPSPTFGSRLLLRSPTLADAPSLRARAQNPFCVSHIAGLRYSKPTLAGYESLISAWQTQSAQLKSRFLIVVLASTGESIGDTGFESLHPTIHGYGDKVANGESGLQISEAGIMLDDSPAIRGQGYAIEALNMVFEYGFDVLSLDEDSRPGHGSQFGDARDHGAEIRIQPDHESRAVRYCGRRSWHGRRLRERGRGTAGKECSGTGSSCLIESTRECESRQCAIASKGQDGSHGRR
jgi:RimJ/RimL family protein N-acetyltransferase